MGLSDPIDTKFWLLYSIVPKLSNATNPTSSPSQGLRKWNGWADNGERSEMKFVTGEKTGELREKPANETDSSTTNPIAVTETIIWDPSGGGRLFNYSASKNG